MVLDKDVACVILKPFVFEEPKNNFLHELQTLCQTNGTLLIFDKMWTGFRIDIEEAQTYFDIKPDLAVYSKAVANEMPISLLTSKKKIMLLFKKNVFFFTTFDSEALSLAASIATISELRAKNVPAYLLEKGNRLKNGYNQLAAELGIENYTKCTGYDC